MIDAHSHILPGIDDGSPDMKHSAAMARTLVDYGFEAVIATPHVMPDHTRENTLERISALAEELSAALWREGVGLRVFAGAEYYMDRSLPGLVREHHPIVRMAGSHYVLVEMPMLEIPPYMDYSVFPEPDDPQEIAKTLPFLRPVIAHPERNQKVLRDPSVLRPLRDQGYYFQVNLASAVGAAGRRPLKVIKKMAAERMIDLVATDAHDNDFLLQILPDWRRQLEKILKDQAEKVLYKNPLCVLEDGVIEFA